VTAQAVARTIVLIVAKAPVPGLVKTRLCPPATPSQAARLAAACLLDTVDTVLSLPWAHPIVAITGEINAAENAAELSERLQRVTVVRQRGVDFAERLANAHLDAGRNCSGLPILQIGMDTPQVGSDELTRAAQLLTAAQGPPAVLGPATDGGWWALGLRRPPLATVLTSVRMSQVDTGLRTREVLERAGCAPELLSEQSDVDFFADVGKVAALAPKSRLAREFAAMPLAGADVG
jgi:uncharacterized protein